MVHYELIQPMAMPKTPLRLTANQLPELIHLDDCALCGMWDFSIERLPTVPNDLNLDAAIKEIELTKSHHLLVVDKDGHTLAGIISGNDLFGEKPIKWLQQSGGDRAQLKMRMLMTPITEALLLPFGQLQSARIGNIIHTFQNEKKNYALALEHNPVQPDSPIIRGLFSLAQIKKQLHGDVPVLP